MKLKVKKRKINRIIIASMLVAIVTLAVTSTSVTTTASANSIIVIAAEAENPATKIKTYLNVIKTIFSAAIVVIGAVAVGRGFSELGSAISARDFGNGAKPAIAECIGGIIAAAAGAAMLYFTF